eukprot:scaffold1668_cov113-Isochrysis_galbana.AAC.7
MLSRRRPTRTPGRYNHTNIANRTTPTHHHARTPSPHITHHSTLDTHPTPTRPPLSGHLAGGSGFVQQPAHRRRVEPLD